MDFCVDRLVNGLFCRVSVRYCGFVLPVRSFLLFKIIFSFDLYIC